MKKNKPFYLADRYVEPDCSRVSRDDQVSQLESKVMALLLFFVSRAGEVVSREEIEEVVWGDTIVGYDALTASIAKLRKALNDNSRNPVFIATIPKKGYQLIAPVNYADTSNKKLSPDNTLTQSTKRQLPRFAFGGIVIAGIAVVAMIMAFKTTNNNSLSKDVVSVLPSIAVLPFEEISEGKSEKLFGDGITEDITSAIGHLSGVKVVARSSTQRYQENRDSVKKIGADLGVKYLLEGSVRRAQSKMRINVRLIDAESGFQLWGRKYNGELENLFSIEQNIIQQIASHLSIQISKEENRQIAKRYTTDFSAYSLFLQGQQYFSHHSVESNEQARRLFSEAIELDPYFARAYSAAALTYVDEMRYQWNDDPIDERKAAKQAIRYAEKALSMDDKLAQAHWVLANVHLFSKNHQEAIVSAEKALALHPNYADAYATLAVSYIYSEQPKNAIKLIKNAMALNPDSPARYRSALGQAYYFLGEYQDAEIVLTNAIERNSALAPARIFLLATLGKLEKKDELKWELAEFKTNHPNFGVKRINAMFPFNSDKMMKSVVEPLRLSGVFL